MKSLYFFLCSACLLAVVSCTKDETATDPGTTSPQDTYYVTPEKTEYEIAAEGGLLEIRFESNVPSDELNMYSVGGTWIDSQASRFSYSGKNYTITLSVNSNTGGKRNSSFLICQGEYNAGGTLLCTLTVTQKGTEGESADYTADGTVRTLQTATKGSGLSIVIMGDGFIDTEIADGTYAKVMDKACENLFSIEPLTSLRDYFSVYAVTAVSKNNNFGTGYSTAFSCVLEGGGTTGIKGNETKVQTYVRKVPGVTLAEALAVVILNTSDYAGTTYFGYTYPSDPNTYLNLAIAYCPVIEDLESALFQRVLIHEAMGHGFAKLGDEYFYAENGTIPETEITKVRIFQKLGWDQNVDFTSDPNEVLWSPFLSDSRYTAEKLGVYEGGYTYIHGAYRPSEDSMMGNNQPWFNAPSRRAIYNQTITRSGGSQPTYEQFVAFDQTLSASATASAAAAASSRSYSPIAPMPPLPSPRFVNKPLD